MLHVLNINSRACKQASIQVLTSFVATCCVLVLRNDVYCSVGQSFIYLFDLFTYLLAPWSRVLLEKLTSKLCS